MKEVAIVIFSVMSFSFLAWLFVFGGDEYIADAILHTEINRASQYYTALHKKCLQRSSQSCCLSSVDAMEANRYELMPITGCVNGFGQNALKCIDSLIWCEPVIKSKQLQK